MGDFEFLPEAYADVRDDLPWFDELQQRVGAAVRGAAATRVLELGTGVGDTARRVLAELPEARLVGVDASERMLAAARAALPAERVEELRVARLQDELPAGPFDVVFSALTVHHLRADEKRDLFARVARVLASGGRFVLGDLVVPDDPADSVVEVDGVFDVPDRADDQIEWLRDAGLEAELVWARLDAAVIRATRR